MFISQMEKKQFFQSSYNIKISQLIAYFLINLKISQLKNKPLLYKFDKVNTTSDPKYKT